MKLIQPKKFKENQLTKFQKLKKELNSKELSFLMEAHNGLTAKIAESAGFKGIWASGLSISTALGVRDNNEASWTQILDILEFMSDATNIPILVDGDTGYGNFNNFRRLVSKLCQRKIAGVCIEDKNYPKTIAIAIAFPVVTSPIDVLPSSKFNSVAEDVINVPPSFKPLVPSSCVDISTVISPLEASPFISIPFVTVPSYSAT